MPVIVFEDEFVSRLNPITLSRPSYAISCGAMRLLDWLKLLDQPLRGVVQPHLAELQRVEHPELSGELPPQSRAPVLLVNARAVPSRETFQQLRRMLALPHACVVRHGESIAAALLPPSADAPPISTTAAHLAQYFLQLDLGRLPAAEGEIELFEYPHDVIRYNMQILGPNLEHRLAAGAYREIADGVFAAGEIKIGQYVILDAKNGPIVLEEGAVIGPFSLLRGPAHVGRNAKLIEHAAIKDAVSVGHTTKIGGEVEASVIEPFTNKQHHGFLGHSYLGSWINLGAGTCNSDLKNTYGKVNMEYRQKKVPTGMQFVGCIMGDYSKTAINTGIFTGKVIGACSMLYGFVTTNVPSFVNYARLFGQVTELPPDVMIATQERMFRRRQVEQRPCDVQLIHDMYALTRMERQLAGEPLAL